ncbi:MAG: sulfite oxidase [Actinomycetia bacterium]|nr:sulfite oxidase [Actinomycetes bacterium]
MPSRQRTVTAPGVVKHIDPDLMEDTGSGLDFGTRPDRMLGHVTPVDRFFLRSHAPTPDVDLQRWRLHVHGDAVQHPHTYTYHQLWNEFPLFSKVLTIECAGNRRVLFGQETGVKFDGTQWGRGAISTAEWTGVRLRDLLEPSGVCADACEVMAESFDDISARRPLPMAKATADDTLVALAMNGQTLPPDHGFPARLVVSGWLGAASIKWLHRFDVTSQPHPVPWTTIDYVIARHDYPADGPALGPAITALTVSSLVELPWPAELVCEPQIVRGRAYAGENPVAAVEYRIDDGPWTRATITTAAESGVWVRWQFGWHPEPGDYLLRVRATDSRGNTQTETTPHNELGYLHESVLAHPISVVRGIPETTSSG